MEKLKVGFISVSDATTSILAEEICNKKFSEYFIGFSGGTEPRSHIVCDTTKTLVRNYDIYTMSYPKDFAEVDNDLDIVIILEAGITYSGSCKNVINFHMLDPIHKLDEIFDMSCRLIELRLELLLRELKIK